MLDKVCAPAMLYLAFSITQIIIDIFKNLYNTAFLKFIVMIVFTLVLNLLCQSGLGVISWFIVFLPFIMMTVITSLLLFVLGLHPSKGSRRVSVDHLDRENQRHREAGQYREEERRLYDEEKKISQETRHWKKEREHEEEKNRREQKYNDKIQRRRQRKQSPRDPDDPYDWYDGKGQGYEEIAETEQSDRQGSTIEGHTIRHTTRTGTTGHFHLVS